ncbi:MAG: T9SS type A sorting domain-containing protein [Bacteroidales bacterium]|nr:T9SS type A sorting domain-containing protein [Bacteroidales bacterium]
MKTNIRLVIALVMLLASMHVGCLKAQRIIDTNYYRYASTPLQHEVWNYVLEFDGPYGVGHIIDSVSMCTKGKYGFWELYSMAVHGRDPDCVGEDPDWICNEDYFNGYWENPLPHSNIDIYGAAIFLDSIKDYHSGDYMKIYLCEKSEEGTHFETLDSIVLDASTMGVRRYMIHPFSLDVWNPEYEYDSINYVLYPIAYEDCTQFDMLVQVLEVYFDHPVHVRDANLYWKYELMKCSRSYFSFRINANISCTVAYNEDCTFEHIGDSWDHVMAITEPLPQWEQDSLEVLITDVIYDPDDPDNPGGDEGIGEVDGGLQSAVSLRPNPTSGVTTVSCAEAISELTVCDMAGRVVLRKAACGTTATFDTSTLRKGVYLVKVTTARGTVTKKLVVEP